MEAFKYLLKKAVLFLIIGYQKFISPLSGPSCRFVPTCSAYAKDAIEHFGVLRGGCLTCRRLLRCHPWSQGGVDLVPRDKGRQ